jgi:flagellar hook-length control protein FliK
MNVGLPTIILGGLEYLQGSGVAPSGCAKTKGANQFTPVSANDTANNGSGAVTTDNNATDTTKNPIAQQMQEFCQVYCEGIKAAVGKSSSQNAETPKTSVAKKTNLELTDGSEVAQVFAGFKVSKSSSSTDCASKQAGNKLVLTPNFAGPLIANSSIGKGKNSDEAPVSSKTIVSQKYLSNQVIAKKTAEVLTGGGRETADNEISTLADKLAGSGNQKAPVDAGLLANQNKSLDGFGLDKSATLIKKPTDSKAGADQQAVSNMPELTESSRSNDKGCVTDSVLNDSILKKLNSEQIISFSKTKDDGNSSAKNSNFEDSSPKTFKQVFSVNNAQYSGTEQSSATASASKMANTSSPNGASTSVGKQIQESIYSSLKQGEQQITIRLNPPELGKVSIQFREQDGQLVGLLEVSRAQTRTEVQQALPQIIQNLAESGIQVKRLEVLLTNQQEQQGFKDPSLAAGADGWSGRGQAGANSDSQGSNPGWVETDEWLTNDQSYTGFIEPAVQITDDSVNILV